MTIFISLASYREPELRDTILSALENADCPEDLHFGVYSQVSDGEHPDLSDIPNVVEKVVGADKARGPGYARAQVMKMFNGQDYFLQIDAHSIFVPGWDTKTISLYKRIQEESGTKKIIISFWGKPYMRDINTGEVLLNEYQNGKWDINEPHYTELVPYGGSWIGGRVSMPAGMDYHESACALGGFIFAQGDLVVEVPYDPEISWTGEEFMFSIRAYTRGWRIYSPRELLLYHNYERHNNPRIWSDKPANWTKLEHKAKFKLYSMLSLKNGGVYGIGDKKMYAEYQKKHRQNVHAQATKLLRRMIPGP